MSTTDEKSPKELIDQTPNDLSSLGIPEDPPIDPRLAYSEDPAPQGELGERKICPAPGCIEYVKPYTGRGIRPTWCAKHTRNPPKTKVLRSEKPDNSATTVIPPSAPAAEASIPITDEGEWDPAEAFTTPLRQAEVELASRLEFFFNILAGTASRFNTIDGLIIGEQSEELAKALVLEARVNKTVRKIVNSIGSFGGSGPLVMVLFTISTQIMSNHKVPFVKDVVRVPDNILESAGRTQVLREKAAEARVIRKEQARAQAQFNPNLPITITCPVCQRNLVMEPGVVETECMCHAKLRRPS